MKLRGDQGWVDAAPSWQEAWAAEAFSFNRAHLHGAAQVDLQKYQYGNPLHAGQYRSTLSVNGRDLGKKRLLSEEHDGQLEALHLTLAVRRSAAEGCPVANRGHLPAFFADR